ncbi:TPA: hypothetical protein ACX6PN_001216 [Photobacterium damselae]
MTFLYPFNQQNGSPYPSQKAFESVLKKTKQGTFGFNGRNFSWHGGVHVNRDSAPWLQDESPLQAIADGVVVACRISDTYQHSTFEGQTLDYSSDFCLIQHTVTNPKQSGEAFTFYALYMHLAPLCAPHRALSKYPRYRLRTSQSGLLGEVSGESITLEQGSIIEATNEEIVQQDGYGFKPFTVIRTQSGKWTEKTVWLAVEKDDPPSDVRRRFLGDAEQYQALVLDNKAWVEPDLWQPPRSLKRGCRVKALSLKPVRSGDYLMHAYELLDSQETVWFVTGKYESSSPIFETYADPYQLPSWLLTKMIGRTRVEGLIGRGDPKSNAQGELEAGAMAFRLPKGTLLRFDKTQDCSLQKLNGEMRLMARCQIATTTPVKNNAGQLAREVWVCVEEEFIEVVQADTVTLNTVECFGSRSSLVVSAGDAIGYLGRYDVANGEEGKPPVTERHQVHFELLSNEQPPQFFIDMYLGQADKDSPYFVLADNSGCDGFLDLDNPSPFFQQLSAHTGKQGTTGFDILRNLADWDSEKTVIAQHESEWAVKSSEKAFLSKLVEKVNKPRFTALIEHEKERIDTIVWLPEVSKLGLSKDVWNWWPIHYVESTDDVNDVYLVIMDEDINIEAFAQQTYHSKDKTVIDHILRTNPHLKRSFHQIVAGMPMVVSPYTYSHAGEADALSLADELMTEFLTLNDEQKAWYGKNSALVNHTALMLPPSESGGIGWNDVVVGSTAAIAGYQIIHDSFNNRLEQFAQFMDEANKELQYVDKANLKSHPKYKAYRQELKLLEQDLKGLFKQYWKPSYLKELQVPSINELFNVGNRQLYRTADFAESFSAINAAKVFKDAMKTSRILGLAGDAAFLLGVESNIKDMWGACDSNDLTEECARTMTRNYTSIALNYKVGEVIMTASFALAPYSMGLSLVGGISGTMLWGYFGGGLADTGGELAEYILFDLVFDNVKNTIEGIF